MAIQPTPWGMLYISKFLCSSHSQQRVHNFWDLHVLQELRMKGNCMMVPLFMWLWIKEVYPSLNNGFWDSSHFCKFIYIYMVHKNKRPWWGTPGRGSYSVCGHAEKYCVIWAKQHDHLQLSSSECLNLQFCTDRVAELNQIKPFEKLFSKLRWWVSCYDIRERPLLNFSSNCTCDTQL